MKSRKKLTASHQQSISLSSPSVEHQHLHDLQGPQHQPLSPHLEHPSECPKPSLHLLQSLLQPHRPNAQNAGSAP